MKRAWIAPIAIITALIGSMLIPTAAMAAETDLVVNVAADKGAYEVNDVMTFTTEVTSRGPGALTGPAEVRLNVPLLNGTTEAWNTSATCVASGGAVCPTSYTLQDGGATLVASVSTLPPLGKLVITASATVQPATFRLVSAVTATVKPAGTDVDAETSTNTASVTIVRLAPITEWDVTATGPATVPTPGNTPGTYTVTLSNHGENTTAYYVALATAVGQGSGTASTLPYVSGAPITGIMCASATGGASCDDVAAVTSQGAFLNADLNVHPENNPYHYIGVSSLPAGASIVLTVTVDIGQSLCSTDAEKWRTVTLTSTIPSFFPTRFVAPDAVAAETVNSTANNTASAVTNIGALTCGRGDLSTTALTLTQGGLELQAGEAFAFEATYSNSSIAPTTAADGATIHFSFSWPAEGGQLGASPTCVAAGGAVCPTAWTIDGLRASATVDTFPIGGSLTVTYTGTGGENRTDVCRPRSASASAYVLPSASFLDVNYNPDSLPNWGNNRRQVGAQTNVGSPCNESHDDEVLLSGPYTDAAATQLLVGPASPGQALYFKSTITNLPSSPTHDFVTFYHGVSMQDNPMGGGLFTLENGFSAGDASDPATRWRMSHQPGDPASLPLSAPGFQSGSAYPHLTGVRCVEAVGATCPIAVGGGNSSGGGGVQNYMNTNGFSVSSTQSGQWAGGDAGVMADSGHLTFISTYRIPPYYSVRSNGQCAPIAADRLWNVPVDAYVEATTNPLTNDRRTSDDRATSQFSVLIKACTDSLNVTKTVTYPSGTTVLGPDRKAEFEIVATNNSTKSLDIPWIRDFPSPYPQSATIECVSTTGGAQCPDYVPEFGVSHRVTGGTGTTVPLFSRKAAFDFEWGSPGADTMPAGSTVTFKVSMQYSLSGPVPVPNNIAFFTSDPSSSTGAWMSVYRSVSLSVPAGTDLGLQKSVNPSQPKPGEKVTFTVDLFNPTKETASNLFFTDLMHPLLQATNPSGFGDLTCRPLTAADGLFGGETLTGEPAVCPTFDSVSNGISGHLDSLAGLAGLRLTYTAIAPLDSASAPNIATLTHSDVTLTQGDAASQANLSVLALKLSGTVWFDVDSSAQGGFTNIQTGSEEGTPAGGLVAVLVDSVTGNVLAVTPIADDGTYQFTGVAPGIDVTVVLAPASGAPEVGSQAPGGSVNGGWVPTTPTAQNTFNTGVVDTTDLDFGVTVPSSIGDYVWNDTDKDGVQDEGEKPVAGVKVELINKSGTVIATTTTDANGWYSFGDLWAGTYRVHVIAPSGSGFTTSGGGSDTSLDSDVDSDGFSMWITIGAGEARTDIDAGIIPLPVNPIPGPILAMTGGGSPLGLIGIGGGMLLGGLVVMMLQRRQRRRMS